MPPQKRGAAQFLQDRAIRALLGLALAMPYERRVPFMGAVMARVVAPLAGWRGRVRDNLRLIYPQMPKRQVERLCRAVPDNFGRSLIETYSSRELSARVKDIPLQGPGVAALAEAKATGRPALLITGHFGNYEAPRAALTARGYPIGALYNPMSNGYFNDHYVAAMASISEPMLERSRRGMAEMIRFLRQGGMVGIVVDQFMRHGAPLDFLGRPAYTALSAAEMAVKFDALAIPIYGRRRRDGLGFDIIIERPIPHGPADEMTQTMNDSLAARVADHPEQWFWIHRRWKTPQPEQPPDPE